MTKKTKPPEEFGDGVEGEWMRVPKNGWYMECCDCGLVHRFEFGVLAVDNPTIVDGREEDLIVIESPNLGIRMRVFGEDKLTKKKRKERGITLS